MQVAERALYFWNNEYIMSLIEENNQVRMDTPLDLPTKLIKYTYIVAVLCYSSVSLSCHASFFICR